ncbi:MAG: hypothetical protein ACHP7N_13125 [Caulobacterales bacterium]
MKRLIVALVAVALVGGCMNTSKTPPKDLPDYVKIYPGATQVVAMGLGSMSTEVFSTSASPDEVVSFYRTQAQSDGLPEGSAPAPAGAPPEQKQAEFGDPASGKMLVVVAKPSQGVGTMVSLIYKPAPKAPS